MFFTEFSLNFGKIMQSTVIRHAMTITMIIKMLNSGKKPFNFPINKIFRENASFLEKTYSFINMTIPFFSAKKKKFPAFGPGAEKSQRQPAKKKTLTTN